MSNLFQQALGEIFLMILVKRPITLIPILLIVLVGCLLHFFILSGEMQLVNVVLFFSLLVLYCKILLYRFLFPEVSTFLHVPLTHIKQLAKRFLLAESIYVFSCTLVFLFIAFFWPLQGGTFVIGPMSYKGALGVAGGIYFGIYLFVFTLFSQFWLGIQFKIAFVKNNPTLSLENINKGYQDLRKVVLAKILKD